MILRCYLLMFLLFCNVTAASLNAFPLKANTMAGQVQYSIQVRLDLEDNKASPVFVDLVVDTGSSDIWIQGSQCSGCSHLDSNNPTTTAIEETSSSTFSVKYGSGSIYGTIESITSISFTSNGSRTTTTDDSIILSPINIGITDTETGDISQILAADGILGLGFAGLSTFTSPAITESINSFSLLLSSSASNSVLTINNILPQYVSSHFIKIPVETYDTQYLYWTVGLPSVSFGNTELCNKSRCQAVLDSGTGFIAVPRTEWILISAVLEEIPSCYVSFGLYKCHKDDVPQMRLMIGSKVGYVLELEMEDYTIPSSSEDSIVTIAMIESPLPSVNVWVLGSVFMKNYYINFDVKSKVVEMTSVLEDSMFYPTSVEIPLENQQQHDVYTFADDLYCWVFMLAMVLVCYYICDTVLILLSSSSSSSSSSHKKKNKVAMEETAANCPYHEII